MANFRLSRALVKDCVAICALWPLRDHLLVCNMIGLYDRPAASHQLLHLVSANMQLKRCQVATAPVFPLRTVEENSIN